ncbi:ORF313 [White spot syndrome virus]|uniref:Wsv272 n=3 Tax=White spot syndrome virus TaxID=342409 RepID=Q8VAV6_WSSVS|nr:wsv272 [Shrimp white spot syndrome virus]AFX59646.1 wsv272 [White spot syndrome virus]AAL33275.1 wsv272 [Shrimp white spot syndrome virus]AAL89195.1 WSSV327 [Shrimp white spot syndrome virus]ATU83997.1 ORF313 [White spot syndrome virus]AWQ60849.1 wsv272 [Shrimp white spot syndrome virus]
MEVVAVTVKKRKKLVLHPNGKEVVVLEVLLQRKKNAPILSKIGSMMLKVYSASLQISSLIFPLLMILETK